jgi:hypothetical protein
MEIMRAKRALYSQPGLVEVPKREPRRDFGIRELGNEGRIPGIAHIHHMKVIQCLRPVVLLDPLGCKPGVSLAFIGNHNIVASDKRQGRVCSGTRELAAEGWHQLELPEAPRPSQIGYVEDQ